MVYDLGEHADATGARCECLNNPEGNGIRVHARTGTRHRAQWPGIFTRTEHDAMRAALTAHRRLKAPDRPRQRNGEYWLTGAGRVRREMARNQRAGGAVLRRVVGSLLERERKNGNTVVQRRYGCRAKDSARVACGCGRVFRDAGALEMYVAQQVIAEYENPIDRDGSCRCSESSALMFEVLRTAMVLRRVGADVAALRTPCSAAVPALVRCLCRVDAPMLDRCGVPAPNRLLMA